MTTKKMSRFFGLIPLRTAPERAAPERPISEQIKPSVFMPEQPASRPAAKPTQIQTNDAAGSLMSALHLMSHADESRLTEQEKRMAWELPARSAEPDEQLVPRSTSKARLLVPALEQMRQTQSTLMSGFAAAASTDAADTAESKPATKPRRAARPKQTPEAARQAATPEQAAAPASVRPKSVRKPKQAPENVQPAQAQPAPATSHGWQYSVTLQRDEASTPPAAVEPAATSDASSISLMFQRLRSHAEKPPAPPAPPAAAEKAPGFLNKLWAK